jgi:hypothetical protein
MEHCYSPHVSLIHCRIETSSFSIISIILASYSYKTAISWEVRDILTPAEVWSWIYATWSWWLCAVHNCLSRGWQIYFHVLLTPSEYCSRYVYLAIRSTQNFLLSLSYDIGLNSLLLRELQRVQSNGLNGRAIVMLPSCKSHCFQVAMLLRDKRTSG